MIYGDSRNLLLNLKLLYDNVFLKDGHFTNIARGNTVAGTDVSRLVLDTEATSWFAGVSGVQVWQSPFQEWVYESGITLNNQPFISGMAVPTRASGLYINGTYFTQASGVSGIVFYIDYINGRAIFNTAIPTNSIVQADYSYKHFRVDIANKDTAMDLAYYTDHSFKDNPWSNNNIQYPSGAQRVGTIPAIFIELGDSDLSAYELGNRSAIKSKIIYFHVYTDTGAERDTAMDLIETRWHIVMPMIDFEYAPLPLSGLVSTLSPVYIPYQTLLENVTYNGAKVITKLFEFNDIYLRPQKPLSNLERGIVEAKISIYNMAPTGRIAIDPYSV
jgi:hypothetical protein